MEKSCRPSRFEAGRPEALTEIVEYEHHGVVVKVDAALKGKHREHCLCYRCAFFHPNPYASYADLFPFS